jgi:hypothetical protein
MKRRVGLYTIDTQPETAVMQKIRCAIEQAKAGAPVTLNLPELDSYTVEKPRWRALLPTSKSMPPHRRQEFVGHVKQLLGGVVSRESFTRFRQGVPHVNPLGRPYLGARRRESDRRGQQLLG